MKKILLAILILLSYINANITTPEGAKKACDKGNAKACFNLGAMYELDHQGIKKDISKAIELYKKACYKGDGRGGVFSTPKVKTKIKFF